MQFLTTTAMFSSLLFLLPGHAPSPAAPEAEASPAFASDSFDDERAPAALAPDALGSLQGRGAPQAQGPLGRLRIYVISQGLVYDSVITADPLPMKGQFQELGPGGPVGLQTQFGPGDPGYLGGRWWMDKTEPFGEMNEGDHFFMCPLVGPGRTP